MKRLLVGLLFCVTAQAQEPSQTFDFTKSVKCFKTTLLFKELRETFNEEVIGYSKNSITGKNITITAGKNNTWTLIEFDEKIGCILAIGTGYTPVLPKPTL